MGGASGEGCSSMVAMVVVWRGVFGDDTGEGGGRGDFREFEECVGDWAMVWAGAENA